MQFPFAMYYLIMSSRLSVAKWKELPEWNALKALVANFVEFQKIESCFFNLISLKLFIFSKLN